MIGQAVFSAVALSLLQLTAGQDQNAPTTRASGASSATSSAAPAYTPVFAPNGSSFSAPFYPTPQADGSTSSAWAAALAKARAYIADNNLTLEEKVSISTGVGWTQGRCVGNTPAIERIGWQGLCLEDSPLGVRDTDGVSAFPAGIAAAATFDRDLIYARGYAMGQEFKGKGVNVALGPGMNIARDPAYGRAFEMGGQDPYLSGEGAYSTIRGIQDAGVQATAKHFIANDQERNRTTSTSDVDDRTMHEIYLHPFLRAVQADVASVMCSYNLINSSWACQNSKMQNEILKGELGFNGYIMSDWAATHSGVSSVLAGLDMTMPGDVSFGSLDSYFGANLTQAVNNGSVPMYRVDDMATRILGAWFLTGQDSPDFPEVSFDAFHTGGPNNSHVNVEADHREIIRKMGSASVVLLKNVNGTLPLKAPKSVALIGSDAGPSSKGPNGYPDRGGDEGTLAMGWGSGTCEFPYLVSPLEAIQARAIQDNTLVNWQLNDFDIPRSQQAAANAEVAMVFINADGGEEYITVDGNVGDRNNLTAWHAGDDLVLAVAKNNSNVVVVAHSVNALIIEPWVDHPNVTAILWAGIPGQESGNALADVLYGDYNPSARLPYTIAKNRSDYSYEIVYVNQDIDPLPHVPYTDKLNIDYRHFQTYNITPRYGFGFGLSYTTFELTRLQVYSLDNQWKKRQIANATATSEVSASMTSMASSVVSAANASDTSVLSSLSAVANATVFSTAMPNATMPATAMPNATESATAVMNATSTGGMMNMSSVAATATSSAMGAMNTTAPVMNMTLPLNESIPIGSSVAPALHKKRWGVSVDVTNTGDIDGCEVPQLYIGFPPNAGEPPKVLRGFTRINLQPYTTQTVTFELSRYDLSIWDVELQRWRIPKGDYTIYVGAKGAFDENALVGTLTWDEIYPQKGH